MQLLKVLKEARKLIGKEENWCKGAGARDADGYVTRLLADDAVRFCAVGALERVAHKSYETRHGIINLLRGELPQGTSIVDYNDDPHTTHQDVLGVFDRAIARLEGRLHEVEEQ